MKKLSIVSFLIVFILLSFSPAYGTDTVSPPEITCGSAILMDATSGKALYEKNPDTSFYPASTTKILTSALAIEKGFTWKQTTVSSRAVKSIGIDGSKVGLKPGEKIYVNDLLHMALIPSGNDAANAIAEAVSGNTAAFVRLMNQKVKDLGLTHTTFSNPIGLDVEDGYGNHKTTARDLAFIMRYATSFQSFRSIIGKVSYQMPKTNLGKDNRPIFKNTNLLLNNQFKSENYTVIGGKTGYTKAAKNVLVLCARNSDGIELIAVLMKHTNRSQIFEEAKKLFDYGFSVVKAQPDKGTKGFFDLRYRTSEKAINTLYQKGLLSGSGSGLFDYGSLASKEMFIKVLMNMRGITLDSGGASWSLPYLDQALREGLIDESWMNQKSEPVTKGEVMDVLARLSQSTRAVGTSVSGMSDTEKVKKLTREELMVLLCAQMTVSDGVTPPSP